VLFKLDPHNRVVAAAYFTWFSVSNLFIISVFWSLMADLFSAERATRLFGVIAAGGSIGAILGPVITRLFAPPGAPWHWHSGAATSICGRCNPK